MFQGLVDFCTSFGGLTSLAVASDLAIALAYFAIPTTMAVVFWHRKEDIPYPWLWTLFVLFIVACGITHVVHAWSAIAGVHYLEAHVIIGIVTAFASVGTAIAFAFVLPEIKNLPSPRRQRMLLEEMVTARTAEKDELVREINHRVGNQLQVMNSLVRLEKQRTDDPEVLGLLHRLESELIKMNERHHNHSKIDYLGPNLEADRLLLDQNTERPQAS